MDNLHGNHAPVPMARREFLLAATGMLAVGGLADSPSALSAKERARVAFEAFVKAYWDEGRDCFRRHRGKDKPLDFWFTAHAWDMLIDADRLFRTQRTKELVRRCYDGFCRRHPDWRKNEYNDDILWWTIACTNAYRHTHERRYLEQARTLFDHLAGHEIDDVLGGGMWWKNSEHKCKNACDNFPAVITACNLHLLTHEKKYRELAESLFAWSRGKFFDESTGAVYDNVNLEGRLNRWDFTYNCGTFIGSALRLNRITGRAGLLADAVKAGRHFTGALSRDGIVKPCGKGDGGAFHGVGFRYLAELARRPEGKEFRKYLVRNVESAWAHRRRSDNLVGEDWRKVPDEMHDLEGQVANSALTALILSASL